MYGYVEENPVRKRGPQGLFASPIHFGLSFFAAWNAGFGFGDSLAIAFYSALTDQGTQGIADAYIHGMTPDGWTKKDAIIEWQKYQDSQRSRCTNQGRGNLLHAIQDPYAAGHESFQNYSGLKDLPLSHYVDDWFPSWDRLSAAYAASLRALGH